MPDSVWGEIYTHLTSKGIDVYAPAQHVGECKKSYTVMRNGSKSQYRGYSTTQEVYDFMCYTKNRSELDSYVSQVKNSVSEMRAAYMLKDTYIETGEFYDDIVKGYMKSFQYILYKQIIRN